MEAVNGLAAGCSFWTPKRRQIKAGIPWREERSTRAPVHRRRSEETRNWQEHTAEKGERVRGGEGVRE